MNATQTRKMQMITIDDAEFSDEPALKQDTQSRLRELGFASSMFDLLSEYSGSNVRCVLSVPQTHTVSRHLLLWAELNKPRNNTVFISSSNQKIDVISATEETSDLFLGWFPNYIDRYDDSGWLSQIIPIQREGRLSGYAISVTGGKEESEVTNDPFRSKSMNIVHTEFYGRPVSSLGITVDEEYKLWKFLVENCSGAVKQMGTYLIFEKEEDALLFKMQK